jgi:CoA:oxalate CoA-transferase
VFECIDGWVALAAFNEDELQGLFKAMNRPELYSSFADPLERLKDKNARELLKVITEWCQTKRIAEIEDLGSEYGFAASRVLTASDAYYSQHYRERGAIQEYEDAIYGDMVQHCYPPRLSETPSRLKWGCRPLAFDNEYIFTTILDMSVSEIKKLEERGVIFKWKPSVPSQGPPPDWDGKKGVRN